MEHLACGDTKGQMMRRMIKKKRNQNPSSSLWGPVVVLFVSETSYMYKITKLITNSVRFKNSITYSLVGFHIFSLVHKCLLVSRKTGNFHLKMELQSLHMSLVDQAVSVCSTYSHHLFEISLSSHEKIFME